MNKYIILLTGIIFISSCSKGKKESDATGTFESVETIVSSQSSGMLMSFKVDEGMLLDSGAVCGHIDSNQVWLKKKQLEAQIRAVLVRKPNQNAQLGTLKAQLEQAVREQQRVENLFKGNAATLKQKDDAASLVGIIRKQIEAMESGLQINTNSISEESGPLQIQIAQVNDLLEKSKIVNPIRGTVLIKYAEQGEMVAPGKPLYKIADLSVMNLRAYVSGDQFAKLKLNQEVTVKVDDGEGKFRNYKGIVSWISGKAEFTPKTIQTKDERANLVYAIKVKVKNTDGLLKLGMYGELIF